AWAAQQKTPSAMSPAPATPPPGAAAPVTAAAPQTPAAAPAAQTQPTAPATPVVQAGYTFPQDRVPGYAVPHTELPQGLTFPADLKGDAARGREIVTTITKAPCLTCHNIRGEQQFVTDDQAKGPNLTHVASRTTIGAGLFPNDDRHLALWIKNVRRMKP